MCCALTPTLAWTASPRQFQLRIQWQDDAGGSLQGSIELEQGHFEDVRNLSFDGATTGSLRMHTNNRALRIAPRGNQTTSGVLLRAIATADTSLQIELRQIKEMAESVKPLRVKLGDLKSEPSLFTLVPGRKVWVSRVEGDLLQVESKNRDSLMHCGDDWPIEVSDNGCKLEPGHDYVLRCEIVTAREGAKIAAQDIEFQTDRQGTFAPLSVALKVPATEGVYDLNVRLVQPQRFQRERVYEWRRLQFVALQTDSPSSQNQDFAAPRTIPYSIEPVKDASWLKQQFSGWLPGNDDRAPLHWSNHQARRQEAFNETCLELAPGEVYAVELTNLVLNKPHLLTIRVPASQTTKLQACIAEPDSHGKFLPIQVDTAIVVPTPVIASPEQWSEHRVVFWPKSVRPVLVLSNHHAKTSAVIAPLQISGGIDHLPSIASGGSTPEQRREARQAFMYLAKPAIAEAFGVSLATDPESGALLHDWVSFYQAGQRLVEYLKWAGYEGAMLNVCSEGGTLYPTNQFAATARYDSGAYFSRCHDPCPKDVVELLLRLFDREGLKLTPMMELNTPLHELESQLEDFDLAPGVEPINGHAEKLVERISPIRGQAMYYNALDVRVQTAIKHTVQEFCSRYQSHASFSGLALQLNGRNYIQLPEVTWTLDPATLARYAEELPGQLPAGTKLSDWVVQTGRAHFLQWRAREHSQFIASLAKSLRSQPLYLVANDFANQSNDLTNPELEYGWDWELLASQTNVIPLRYYRHRPLSTVAQQIQDTSLEGDARMDRRMGVATAVGAISETPPERITTPQFPETSPWEASQSPEFLLPHAVNSGDDARLCLARLLAPYDRWPLVIGGWTPPRGNETVTREWLQVYQALPIGRFENIVTPAPDTKHGLTVVRRLRTENCFYVYALNLAPWAVSLTLELDNQKQIAPIWLGKSPEHRLTPPNADVKSSINTTLASGAIIAIQFDSPEVDVVQWSTVPCADQMLASKCAEKLSQLSIATHDANPGLPPIEIANGDFEMKGNGDQIPLWNVTTAPGTRVFCDASTAATGRASLCLESDAKDSDSKAWAISSTFQAPPGSRLAISARIKPLGKPKSIVSMTLEGKVRGQPWRRSLTIPAFINDTNTPPNQNWPATIHKLEVTDLPTTGLEELRIAFDLTGQGKVWVDDVRVNSILLTAFERKTLQEDLYLAIQKLKNEDVSAAGRLLALPWTRELISYTQSLAKTNEPKAEPVEQPKPPIKSAERVRSWIPKLMR